MSHQENAPISITPGAIRFNTDSMKLEYFRIGMEGGSTSSYAGIGTLAAGEWVQITTDTPTGDNIESPGTRGLRAGGYNPSPSPGADVNTIYYITIASDGNTEDFGDLIRQQRHQGGGVSNQTRGIFAGGYKTGSGAVNVIEYVQIKTLGNTADFGDLSSAVHSVGGCSNSTRGLFAGDAQGSPTNNTIQYVTISTLGNTTDFGDLTIGDRDISTASSPTRGIFAGGHNPSPSPGRGVTIDYVQIASTGNAIDFGDLQYENAGRYERMNATSRTRCVFQQSSPAGIEYIEMNTTGNAVNFGTAGNTASSTASGRMCDKVTGVFKRGTALEKITISSGGAESSFGTISVSNDNCGANCDGHGGLG